MPEAYHHPATEPRGHPESECIDRGCREQVEASRNPLYDALCKNLIGKILDRGSPADPMMDIALRLEATLRDRDLARQQVEAAQLDWSCPLCHCCGEKRHDEGDPCVSCATAVEAFRERLSLSFRELHEAAKAYNDFPCKAECFRNHGSTADDPLTDPCSCGADRLKAAIRALKL